MEYIKPHLARVKSYGTFTIELVNKDDSKSNPCSLVQPENEPLGLYQVPNPDDEGREVAVEKVTK